MMSLGEPSGWIWFLIDVAFVVVLAGALAYGMVMYRNRRRNRLTEQRRDEATNELYGKR
jgi:hypothetical protein